MMEAIMISLIYISLFIKGIFYVKKIFPSACSIA